jgi:hypothetical protein
MGADVFRRNFSPKAATMLRYEGNAFGTPVAPEDVGAIVDAPSSMRRAD